jgi:FkbM family methyltransferase
MRFGDLTLTVTNHSVRRRAKVKEAQSPTRMAGLLPQVVHAGLVRTGSLQQSPQMAGRLWRKAYAKCSHVWERSLVTTTLHGRRTVINFANPYPLFIRRFPFYNAPQVELVLATSEALGRPLHVVDVGAAIGDTALLLLEKCRDQISRLDCIEGEHAFAQLLSMNLGTDDVFIHESVLSETSGDVATLVRSQHQGTASAEGPGTRDATTLDCLLAGKRPDVIKVDTDGFDGPILAGARDLISGSFPAVLFEWHPVLCKRVGTDDSQGFGVLEAAGYDRFVFFNKFGEFSHFGTDRLDSLRRYCLTEKSRYDWHYDVIALHPNLKVDEVGVADLRHWAPLRGPTLRAADRSI